MIEINFGFDKSTPIRGYRANTIICDEYTEMKTEIKKETEVNEIKYYAEKGNLSRNDKCPCGSKKKVKSCHKHFLNIRHYVVQREINVSNALAAHNKAADMNKEGYKKLTREQFIETLDLQENAEKLQNSNEIHQVSEQTDEKVENLE